MSDKNFKVIRKQLRSVVQEILPELISTEMAKSIESRVDTSLKTDLEKKVFIKVFVDMKKLIDDKLEALSSKVDKALTEMDARSKDIQSFLVRQAIAGMQEPEAVVSEPGTNPIVADPSLEVPPTEAV